MLNHFYFILFCILATASVAFFGVVVQADDHSSYLIHTYHATIEPLTPDVYDVSGYVVLFTKQDVTDDDAGVTERQSTIISSESYLGYAGKIYNIESNLTAASCTQKNGCGVHVHSGTSCTNTTTQGGHYYNNETLDVDPWIEARYFTDTNSLNDTDMFTSNFWGLLDIGSADIDGRAFIVHSENGTRIGCGIIEKVTENLLSTATTNLTDSDASSHVVVYANTHNDHSGHTEGDGDSTNVVTCYFGVAESLEPELESYLHPDPFLRGIDCNFTNGCGVHIHNGTACTDKATQGGHYYGSDMVDPWLYTMYHATDSKGDAYFTGCVETGITDISSFTGRPFIIHSNDGSRVSCGLLEASATDGNSNSPPSPTSTGSPPSPTTSTTSAGTTTVTANYIFAIIVISVITTTLMGVGEFSF